MSASTEITSRKSKEQEEKESLFRAIDDTRLSDERTRALVTIVEKRTQEEYLKALGIDGVAAAHIEASDLTNRAFPGITSMSLMVETAKIVLERIQESVRETMKRLEPAPHERPLTAVHCTGMVSFEDKLSTLLKVTDDLGKVGALVIDYAVRSNSKLYNDALVLYHKLREYSEIADQNRLAADNCAKNYSIPTSSKSNYALAA